MCKHGSRGRAGATNSGFEGGSFVSSECWSYVLSQGVEVEVVSGVSAMAVPPLAGIPPTCPGVASTFAVIAGHREDFIRTDWSQYVIH